jgi:hypothetical protein
MMPATSLMKLVRRNYRRDFQLYGLEKVLVEIHLVDRAGEEKL